MKREDIYDKKNDHLCLVDSNICIYGFSTDQKEETKRILAKQLIKEKSIIISTQVINGVCRNLLKKYKIDKKSISKLLKLSNRARPK